MNHKNIRVFSPAPGKIQIITLENSIVKVSDILGRRIGIYDVGNSILEIALGSDIYIVSVGNGDRIYTRKVIVK